MFLNANIVLRVTNEKKNINKFILDKKSNFFGQSCVDKQGKFMEFILVVKKEIKNTWSEKECFCLQLITQVGPFRIFRVALIDRFVQPEVRSEGIPRHSIWLVGYQKTDHD